ncbi:L-lactate dehydrogenase [Sarracenia purpurea var. burkii]
METDFPLLTFTFSSQLLQFYHGIRACKVFFFFRHTSAATSSPPLALFQALGHRRQGLTPLLPSLVVEVHHSLCRYVTSYPTIFVNHTTTDYVVTVCSDLCIITVDTRQKPGDSRLNLLQRNVTLFSTIVSLQAKSSRKPKISDRVQSNVRVNCSTSSTPPPPSEEENRFLLCR